MAKRISQHKIDEIYGAIDIVDLVGDFLELKKRGTNFFALSPWSNEKTPSMAISPSKNIFKDFSSQKGGNGITFLMELEGMSYVEALTYVAKKYGISLEFEEKENEDEGEDNRESLYILNEFASKWFTQQLLTSGDGRAFGLSYLKERGILETTIKEFEIGYCPKGNIFTEHALTQKHSEEFLLETGLSLKSEYDNKLYDRFKERLIFPIRDHLGKTLGFGGRILGKKEKAAKYVNSPESSVYHKSNVLYGIDLSRPHIRSLDQAILVEGYMDVISLYQNGIKNVVATSGTALTENQIRLLKRFSQNVTLLFDSDSAGVKATMRGIDLLVAKELTVKVLVLPEGHDPDSFVKENGKSGFDKWASENSADFLDYKISTLLSTHSVDDPNQKTEIIHSLGETLALIPDLVKQSIYLEHAAKTLQTSKLILEGAVKKAYKSIIKNRDRAKRREQNKVDRQKEENKGESSDSGNYYTGEYPIPEELIPTKEPLIKGSLYYKEKEVIHLLINFAGEEIFPDPENPEEGLFLADFLFQSIKDFEFQNPVLEEIKNTLLGQFASEGKVSTDSMINSPNSEIKKMVEEFLVIPEEISPNWSKFMIKVKKHDDNLTEWVKSAIGYLQLAKINHLLKESSERIRDSKKPEEIEELTRKFLHLRKMKFDLETGKDIHGGTTASIINS